MEVPGMTVHRLNLPHLVGGGNYAIDWLERLDLREKDVLLVSFRETTSCSDYFIGKLIKVALIDKKLSRIVFF
jgi:hypothetical protein